MADVEIPPLALPGHKVKEQENARPARPSGWPYVRREPARMLPGEPYVSYATRDLAVAIAVLEEQAISLPDESGLVLVAQRDLDLLLRAYERLCLDTALVFAAKKQGVLK